MRKKTFLVVTFFYLSFGFAQEVKDDNKSINFSVILKSKVGFGELKIDDYGSINGFYSAVEILGSSKISKRYNLEYGIGLSEFKANNLHQSNLGTVRNQNVYLPVNLIRNSNLNNNSTIQFGIGLYGNYLYKSEIDGVLDDKNIDFNFGANLQVGAKFNIAEETSFRVMLESLCDLTTLKKDTAEFKQINTNVISLSFIHNF